ncbi:MAG: hypothetical protein IKK08_00880 [Clostridia bacterium]|nr:hypothetical protein [Clostridia bacterium]
MSKTVQIQDERLARQQNALGAVGYWMVMALQAVALAVKLLLGAGLRVCVLDLAVLAVGAVGMVLVRTRNGLWGQKDEALREIDQAGLAKVFMVQFFLILIGEFLLFFLDDANLIWYLPYLPVWIIPALYVMIRGYRSGLYTYGTKKAETHSKRQLLWRTALGALFFGIVMGGPDCFRDGAFQLTGLWKVLGMGLCWGVLFYGMMLLFLKLGDKKADQLVAAEDARPEGENDEE